MAPVPEDSPLLHLAFPQHRAGHGQGCRRTCSTSTGCPSHHGNRTQGGVGLHWQHHLVGQDRIHGGGSKPLPCQLCEVPTSLLLPSHEKGYFRSCVMYVFCMTNAWSMVMVTLLIYQPKSLHSKLALRAFLSSTSPKSPTFSSKGCPVLPSLNQVGFWLHKCVTSLLTCPSTDGPNHPSKQQQPSCSCTPESFCQSPTDKVRMNEICAQLCCKEPSPPSKIRP